MHGPAAASCLALLVCFAVATLQRGRSLVAFEQCSPSPHRMGSRGGVRGSSRSHREILKPSLKHPLGTPALLIGPLELHRVAIHGLEVPRADVADLAVVVVIPAGPGNRIGDRFTQLVGAGARERVEGVHAAETTAAGRVRHYRVINSPGMVVVAAVVLAGTAPAHDRS